MSMAITLLGEVPEAVWATQILADSGVDLAIGAQLVFPGGAVAQLTAGFRGPFRQGTLVAGDRATLEVPASWFPGLDGQPSTLVVTDHQGRREEVQIPAVDPYGCEVRAMEACVLDGAAPAVPLSQSRTFVSTVVALHAAAHAGALTRLVPGDRPR
jgi:xylose dehydrogenase (NAD/NADP)